MKFVFFLGALIALLAVSSAKENENKEIDDTVRDVHNREVRDVGKKKPMKKRKKGNKGRRRKHQTKKGRKGRSRKNPTQKGSKGRRRNEGKRKENKVSKKRTRKRLNRINRKNPKDTANNIKNPSQRTEERETRPACGTFLTETNVRDFRYVKNMVQKAQRVEKILTQTAKKTEKAATAFQDGTDFYKSCGAAGSAIYNELRNCNVTAKAACDPSPIVANPNFTDLFANITICIADLKSKLTMADKCLKVNCVAAECNYVPMGNGNCDYRELSEAMADLKKKCNSVSESGAFGYCSKILKDSYGTAEICCGAVTTMAPSRFRFKDFWKKNVV